MRRLAIAALLCSGCASILRSSQADVPLFDAPPGMQVYSDGQPVPVTVTEDGGKIAHVDWGTDRLELRANGTAEVVDLSHDVALGWLLLDIFTFSPGVIVDLIAHKAENFNPVRVPSRLAMNPGVPQQAQPAAYQPAPAPAAAPVAAAPARATPHSRLTTGRVAVLDFAGKSSGLEAEQMRYFADQVRGEVVKLNPALEVITRENLLVLLKSNGKDPSQCEGECEVETGRLINADAVISGDLIKVGTRYKLSLRLHETKDGRLLATAAASGKTIDELDESSQAAVDDLLIAR